MNIAKPIEQYLADLERQRFFGLVELKYEAGQLVLIRKSETLKPTWHHVHTNGDNRNESKQR
jgi:hypothetical protein